jgi:integrase/recombinase XerD
MHSLATMPEAHAADDRIVDLWVSLHESPHTRRAYRAEAERFLSFVGKGLREIGYGDMIAYRDGLGGSPASKRRALAAVKSLFSFGHRIGALPFNVGGAVKGGAAPNRLAERIMSEDDMRAILRAAEGHPRDYAILNVAYYAGLRVSELTALTWRDFPARGLLVVANGKGGTSRTIRIPDGVWDRVIALRDDAGADAYVFAGRRAGTALDESSVLLIVRRYAKLGNVKGAVSPHWLRHAHASHSLDRGATVAEVRDTLGHGSIATTSRYLHARPDRSSGLRLF